MWPGFYLIAYIILRKGDGTVIVLFAFILSANGKATHDEKYAVSPIPIVATAQSFARKKIIKKCENSRRST